MLARGAAAARKREATISLGKMGRDLATAEFNGFAPSGRDLSHVGPHAESESAANNPIALR
jgi:hypothetical protein